ncbi:MAG: hypothetical protein Q8P20_07010 [bacterium]|nr:hypothetical protein [bacterium]
MEIKIKLYAMGAIYYQRIDNYPNLDSILLLPYVDFNMNFDVIPKLSFDDIKSKHNGQTIKEVNDKYNCSIETKIEMNDDYNLQIEVGSDDQGTPGYYLIYINTTDGFTVKFDANTGELIGYTHKCNQGI